MNDELDLEESDLCLIKVTKQFTVGNEEGHENPQNTSWHGREGECYKTGEEDERESALEL